MLVVLTIAACQSQQTKAPAENAAPAASAAPETARARGNVAANPPLPANAGAPTSAATPPAAAPAPVNADGDVAKALAVLRQYYADLNHHDFAQAYAAWANDGPPGHPTQASFARGYATTDSVLLTVGTPGRVEGAAGSRYVTVPVTLRAFAHAAAETDYAGTYTLRRAVVTGASAADRRWHLSSASIEQRR